MWSLETVLSRISDLLTRVVGADSSHTQVTSHDLRLNSEFREMTQYIDLEVIHLTSPFGLPTSLELQQVM